MEPHIWGPHIWRWMHLVAGATYQNEKHAAALLLHVGSKVLPCDTCRQHFAAMARHHNPPEPMRLPIWMWHMHNLVNRRLGKPEISLGEAQSRRHFEKQSPLQLHLAALHVFATAGTLDEETLQLWQPLAPATLRLLAPPPPARRREWVPSERRQRQQTHTVAYNAAWSTQLHAQHNFLPPTLLHRTRTKRTCLTCGRV